MIKQDYTYSLNREKHLINIRDAVKGQDYYCPCCGSVMIPRQGNERRWHFAHKVNMSECSYETYLHKIAKRKICECFNESAQFNIAFHPKTICAKTECPLGAKSPCTWKSRKKVELKQYYNQCDEEKSIDNFRADLVIYNRDKDTSPILVEIFVTHKSTEAKLSSGYRIIEIKVESEEDIDQIVSTASIIESAEAINHYGKEPSGKIRFYNFKNSYKKPDYAHQAYKFRFWINSKGYFKFDNDNNEHVKCLSPNPEDIENSRFLIESKRPIDWDFAFFKLAESGLGIKYCTMCEFYKMNDYLEKSICILYKSKGTKKCPPLSDAMKCRYFKQINYIKDNRIFDDDNQEYKITVK